MHIGGYAGGVVAGAAVSYFDPLVLDLDGDGVELTSLSGGSALFDMSVSGHVVPTGWVGADDGLLAIDRDGDGQITSLQELFSGAYGPDTSTGFEALRALDANQDGILDAADPAFTSLRVWKDANQDAKSDPGELHSLSDLGITSLALTGAPIGTSDASLNITLRQGSFTWSTAATGTLNEVALASLASMEFQPQASPGAFAIFEAADGSRLAISKTDADATIDLTGSGITRVMGRAGNDVFRAGSAGPVYLNGGAGADVLEGGSESDVLEGGLGSDTLLGGAGDDVLLIDHLDTQVDGGVGHDVVFVVDAAGVTLDLAASNVEAVYGGPGNDQFSTTGAASVVIFGNGGADVIQGGSGDDLLAGGAGNDTITGGEGIDAAFFSGAFSGYLITQDGGSVTVVDVDLSDGADDGTDTLSGIERLVFSDRTIHLDGSNNTPVVPLLTRTAVGASPVMLNSGELVGSALDPDGDLVSLSGISNVAGGSVRLDQFGNITFTAGSGYVGSAGFNYLASDGHGGEATGRVQIDVKRGRPSEPLGAYAWHLDAINVYEAWEDYTGKGVLVAINDDGVEYTHPDLATNYDPTRDWDNRNNDADPFPSTGDFHGTAIAGIIGAASNGIGMVGVAYDSTIVAYRNAGVLNFQFEGQSAFDISNNSWGVSGNLSSTSTKYSQDLTSAISNGRNGKGTIIVFSGGNGRADGDNVNNSELRNSRFSIAVGTIDADGKYLPFSTPGAPILVSAPGTRVVTTDRTGANGYSDGSNSTLGPDYASLDGTSVSAPIVSGVVALMLEANPNLGWRDVQEILAYSAWNSDPGYSGWATNGATNWNGGGLRYSHDYGFGLVDARAAVRLAETWQRTSTISNE